MPITTPPYQVPSVDITPDPPIFSLVTTFNAYQYLVIICNLPHLRDGNTKVKFMLLKKNYMYDSKRDPDPDPKPTRK